jgi:hypothetical protein
MTLDRARCVIGSRDRSLVAHSPARRRQHGQAIARLEWRIWQMTRTLESISSLLHEAGETHHRVFRIVDGADADWASWYADWLVNLSELPDVLGLKPVRSELTYLLVSLDKQYTAEHPAEPWEGYYARRMIDHFRPGS